MNEKVDKAIGKVDEAARKYGKIFGMHAGDVLMEKWIGRGMTLLMNSLDINMLFSEMMAIS